MIFKPSTAFLAFALLARAADANIPIRSLTNVNVNDHRGYFSDPYHVVYEDSQEIYISGTTHKYLRCDHPLQPGCATAQNITYKHNDAIKHAANSSNTYICGVAGIHPFQSGSGPNLTWDAVATLHVQHSPNCTGISGWSVIVHASPTDTTTSIPPTSWITDKILIGSFSDNVDATYDGKYFRLPSGQLYLIYQAQYSPLPTKRDGVVAVPMDDPTSFTPDGKTTYLLRPGPDYNSENYVAGNDSFKLIETGNIRAINGKFLMAYSVGAYNRKTYKVGIAWSDTFLPADGEGYRKVLKDNPDRLWKSKGEKEVYYLLQAEVQHDGWRYVGAQVLAPGVPTVASIGERGNCVLLFAGYDPKDAEVDKKGKFEASKRRPYFVGLNVAVPKDRSVKDAKDEELQSWIMPLHG
ncbi:hypothetical protein K461DRAFT_282836 [Myriangium duriaei CBS 260.36]|uniref:Glycoside hydrolase family 43 protein n=1 Tax=Myriangium duriaei CBS 260.36 TaxID=1168546 RepID=A0A9P4IX60_9PEZI|nr:hypothetical protein K461DRAFT_282836 [Myriangium duriaei CBS 260.36]